MSDMSREELIESVQYLEAKVEDLERTNKRMHRAIMNAAVDGIVSDMLKDMHAPSAMMQMFPMTPVEEDEDE